MRNPLFLLLAISLFAAPATVAAQSPVAFTAGGEVCLTQLPVPLAAAPTPTGVLVHLFGEELTGAINDSPDWENLAGAEVMIVIDQETASFNFDAGTFTSSITGRLIVTIEGNIISGSMSGTVSGSFSDPGDLLGSIEESSAQVRWAITDGDGIQARGTATAEFSASLGLAQNCQSVGEAPPFGGTVTLVGRVHGS